MIESVYARLGIRPVINGMGTYTLLGGSLLPAEVMAAMADASQHFVNMTELHEKVGARIAGLLEVPAAMVTAGAASAITVATAACITRGDEAALQQLPGCARFKPEIILQRSHQSGYEAQMRMVGAQLVWVESRAELDRAISDHTAMLFFLNCHEPMGRVSRGEWLRVGKERGIPTFLDAAADVPPVAHLSRYVQEGFDLVAISGGKALRGPQATGLLLGRADLVAAAMKSISPHEGIGRGMKVGKEEMIGLMTAVERYLKLDHDAERRLWEQRAADLMGRLAVTHGISVHRDLPAIANHSPHVVVQWDALQSSLTAEAAARRLMESERPIALLVEGERAVRIAMSTLQDDEHEHIADRLLVLLT